MNDSEGIFVIPHDNTSPSSGVKGATTEKGYVKQIAATLRVKTSELSWLFIEAEGRLALAREWTEEAKEAGEQNWDRYLADIELLESALANATKMLEFARSLR